MMFSASLPFTARLGRVYRVVKVKQRYGRGEEGVMVEKVWNS